MQPSPTPSPAAKNSFDWKSLRSEPYRLLFPLGTVSAIIGIGIWIPFYFWPQAFPYPGQAHGAIQIQGFMLCFIFGFLTTMLPKILGVQPLDTISFYAFPLLILGITGAAMANLPLIAQFFHLLLLLNFLVFIFRRYPHRRSNPPAPFLFIAVAMLADFSGTLAKILALSGGMSADYFGPTFKAGSLLQFQAFPLLLILGVGGFLLPKLFANIPVDPKILMASAKNKSWIPLTLCSLFMVSYAFEILSQFLVLGNVGIQVSYALRAMVWSWFIFNDIRIHKMPNPMLPYLTLARFSLIAIGLALYLPVIFPNYMLAWNHIIFLAGLMPLTLAIASRVLAAHAGRLNFLSQHKRKVWAYGIILILATATRVATEIWTRQHLLHLAIASFLALAALFIWGKIYIPLSKNYPGR